MWNNAATNAWKHRTLGLISFAASKYLPGAEVGGWRFPEVLGCGWRQPGGTWVPLNNQAVRPTGCHVMSIQTGVRFNSCRSICDHSSEPPFKWGFVFTEGADPELKYLHPP